MKLFFNKKPNNNEEEPLVKSYREKCREVINTNNYSAPEASLCLPSDQKILTEVIDLVKKKKTATLKYVIVIGIGGSNLGSKAIYDALYGSLDQFSQGSHSRMIFLDTIDPKTNNAFIQFIDSHIKSADEFVISIISKSGTSTESIANAEILLGHIKHTFPNWKDRCVMITDHNSLMWEEGARLGIDVLGIPKQVGGRYSVLSAVGLFPLAMAGIDIQSLLQGAKQMRELCTSDSAENYAASSSIFQYLSWKKGVTIHNSFYFHPELESLGKWYRQLMGESIGKDQKGITPMVSIGSVDHHSMVQLYWGGAADKTTEIVYSKKLIECIVPREPLFPSLSSTQGKNTFEIMSAIQKGTSLTYEKLGLPYFEVVFEDINCFELGSYMQYKMLEIMYLAKLFEINAFDQPQVELYKIETKKILASK